jgi:putative intracellular protease/amidase
MSLRDVNPVNAKVPKRIAMVLSNPGVSPTTGGPVGFWWSELTHPWYAFSEVGYQVSLFSLSGGRCEADAISDPRDPSGYSASDLVSRGFIATPELVALRISMPLWLVEGKHLWQLLKKQARFTKYLLHFTNQAKSPALYATVRPFCATPNDPMAPCLLQAKQ